MLQDGVNEAIHVRFHKIAIKGDNLIMIQAVKGNIHMPWHISNIIENVHAWLNQDIQFFIKHMFREQNMTSG